MLLMLPKCKTLTCPYPDQCRRAEFNGTWTWDGSTWTKQAPTTSPPAEEEASMAYDAATRNVVLFGGRGDNGLPPVPGPGVALARSRS
jgi:hypothetical protein